MVLLLCGDTRTNSFFVVFFQSNLLCLDTLFFLWEFEVIIITTGIGGFCGWRLKNFDFDHFWGLSKFIHRDWKKRKQVCFSPFEKKRLNSKRDNCWRRTNFYRFTRELKSFLQKCPSIIFWQKSMLRFKSYIELDLATGNMSGVMTCHESLNVAIWSLLDSARFHKLGSSGFE